MNVIYHIDHEDLCKVCYGWKTLMKYFDGVEDVRTMQKIAEDICLPFRKTKSGMPIITVRDILAHVEAFNRTQGQI